MIPDYGCTGRKKRAACRRGTFRRRLRELCRTADGLIVSAAFIALSLRMFAACNQPEEESVRLPEHYDGLEFVTIPGGLKEQIVNYEGMTVSFNADRHIPNWVAWELTAEEAEGTEPRAKSFQRDLSVDGCPEPREYSNSGYDRGHMAPAGDMKWSRRAMEQSFMMTNVCPQVKSFNSGVWARLEEKCRTWALVDSAIVIVAGPVMADNLTETVGGSGIAVPRRFFKVILSPYANPPRAIGFIMDNGAVTGGMQAAAVSVDDVEAVTGCDFFSALHDSIENKVEQECRFHYWSTLKPGH